MSFALDKKEAIKRYILEKIYRRESDFAAEAAKNFGISKTTVYKYVGLLTNEGKICIGSEGKQILKEIFFQKYEYENAGLSEERIYKEVMSGVIEKLPDNVQDIWKFAFTEMVNNAIEHSKSKTVSVTISQNALFTKALICDDGIGIFNGISEYYGMTDLDDAVFMLFKGKLTTDPEHHSGEGIFFTSKAMDSFSIFSCGKSFSVSKYWGCGKEAESVGEFQGTKIEMILFNDAIVKINEVFGAYTTEYAFDKTRIPVRFVSSCGQPISRSEARRLCFGLEKFRIAVLDFEGVRAIGQGFAHELFSVFAKSHETVKLECVNMSDEVERMVRHVMEC